MTEHKAVVLRDIVLDYKSPRGEIRALDCVSLDIEARTSTAIVGRSGSGKSSLVAVIGLMRTPTLGEVWIDGLRVQGAALQSSLRASMISMVFQSFHLEARLTVLENTMLRWFLNGSHERQRHAKARAANLVELVGLGALANRRASDLSGGERQRVAIARALFAQPRILIADEPTGNLDESNAAIVCETLYAASSEWGCAVVVVTHDRMVARGAENTVHLAHGRIVEETRREPQ